MRIESSSPANENAKALFAAPSLLQDVVDHLAVDVFRTELSRPGFSALNFGSGLTQTAFRSLLIGFAGGLDVYYQHHFSRRLLLRSVGRFDQQASTEAHRDGAPAESILMLGYEPSEISSNLTLYDYTRLAAARGLDPQAYLDDFNPTFGSGSAELDGFATRVDPFDRRHYQVVVINNSCLPLARSAQGMLGILHEGEVVKATSGQTRYVNTLLMSTAEWSADDVMPASAIRNYIETGSFTST